MNDIINRNNLIFRNLVKSGGNTCYVYKPFFSVSSAHKLIHEIGHVSFDFAKIKVVQ